MKIRSIVMWATTLVVLLFVNYAIVQKERLIYVGEVLFLELAPRDPRSLIQGDYMVLRYRLGEELDQNTVSKRGKLVLRRGANGIGEFVRVYDDDRESNQSPNGANDLAEDELLLHYWFDGRTFRIGAESFFFQEGQADLYADAEYAELRVAESGESALVGLRGPNLEILAAE
ncbi:GDYXXLXY domain-containing protein [Chloroflexi bacterium TSY]|nr:GDYXXLXY domain-containing protein [Chloroflexi bacterium TSY]